MSVVLEQTHTTKYVSPTDSVSIDSSGFTTGAGTSTWDDTHTTIFNSRALKLPPLSNPEILAVENTVLVLNDITTPTASIGLQADETLLVGTYYGMNLYNSTNLDFGITSTFPYQGSVVFNQEGVGSTVTTTAIKQGSIIIDDPDIPHTTTFTADTISSNGANDFTIVSTNSNLALNCGSGNVTSSTGGFSVSASDFITLTAVNDPIDILADDYINIKTTDGNINLTAIDGGLTGLGKVYVNNTLVNTGDGELWVKDVLMEGIDNSTTVIQTHSANQTVNTGYARLELNSGNIDSVVPPRVILQAFSDATQSPPYTANINKIDLGGLNGEEVIISNGNLGETLPENTITMFLDSFPTSNFIELKVTDPIGGLTSTLLVGNTAYSLSISGQIAETIGSGASDPVTFRRNLSATTFGASGNPCGLLEKTALNAVTSGTTTFTISNAFQTTINIPLAVGRIFVLPAPSAGSIGYWYGICNKSTVNTISIQYPAGTTIATIGLSPTATNGGSVARFAVDYNGTSYSRIA